MLHFLGVAVLAACVAAVSAATGVDGPLEATVSGSVGQTTVVDALADTTFHPTSTTLATSANPAGVGAVVTYSATVSPVPDGGTVTFTDGGSGIDACPPAHVDTVTGVATCDVVYDALTPTDPAVPHVINATYGGDPDFGESAPVAPPIAETVIRGRTALALSASANPSMLAVPFTYTATFNPVPDGGTVSFTDGGAAIPGCTAMSVAAGSAICPVTYTALGPHAIAAAYVGDTDFWPSASNTLVETSQIPTATSVVQSAGAQVSGDAVTYTATVAPNPEPGGGAVAFTDNGATIAGCGAQAVDVTAATATCATSYGGAGAHQIVAAFAGSAAYTASISEPLSITVVAAPKPTPTPVVKPAAGRTGLRAAALMLACGSAKIVLTDVQMSGSRVTITVAASLSLVGKQLKIHLAGSSTALATVAVPANGLIPLTVSAPAKSSSANDWYYATVGTIRSATVPLMRRLVVNALSIARGRITISGRVVTPLTAPVTNVTVSRRVACGRFVIVAKVRPRADGAFAVTLSASTTAHAALYTATTQVPQTADKHAKATANGLAQVVTLGNPPIEVGVLGKPLATATRARHGETSRTQPTRWLPAARPPNG